MFHKQILIGFAVVLSAAAPARAQSFDFAKLAGICNDVYQNFENKDARSPVYYQYERRIYDAAGVTVTQAEAEEVRLAPEKIARVQALWRAAFAQKPHGPLSCDQANFDVQRGSILKYAIAMKNYDFLALAAEVWKVDLNLRDPYDDRTVLDYAQKEIDRSRGSKNEAVLQGYYDMLRKAGAKHAREIEP